MTAKRPPVHPVPSGPAPHAVAPAHSRAQLITGAAGAFLVGGLVTLQSLVNGRLAEHLGGGFAGGSQAALVSFVVGLTLLCVGALVFPRGRRGIAAVVSAVALGRLRPWQVVGGAAGAFLVLSQGVTVPTIGVALFTVAVVAGQSASGLIVDRAGLGPAGRRGVTVGRLVGALLAVVAVGFTVAQRLDGAQALAGAALLLALLPLLAGAGSAWQQAVNGRVAVVGGPLAATWTNFVVGTAVLAIVWLVVELTQGHLGEVPPFFVDGGLADTAWLYLGGAIGVLFIAMAAVLVRVLGVLVLGLCSVSGQVIAAVALDLVTGQAVGALTITGAVLTMAGVVIAAVSTRMKRSSG